MTATPFRFVLSADFYDEAGELKYDDIGLSTFDDHPGISTTTMAEFRQVVMPGQLQNCHGSLLLTPHVTADSVRDCDDLLVIARFGVGYDSVDVPACTEQSVLVTIAVGAVDRPVAEATVGWMIALTHHMLVKDRLVRTGDWDKRSQYMGCELRDRTLGMVGLGRIGRSVVKLLEGFGMNQPVGFDPFLSQDAFDEIGVRSVGLQELLQTADFVSLHCPLTGDASLSVSVSLSLTLSLSVRSTAFALSFLLSSRLFFLLAFFFAPLSAATASALAKLSAAFLSASFFLSSWAALSFFSYCFFSWGR